MPKKLKRALMLVAAVFFILLGLVGLVLPFLQGILFLAIGFILLSLWSPTIRVWMDGHTIKYPRLHKIVKETEVWVVKIIGEA